MEVLALTGESGWVPDGLPLVVKGNSFPLLGNKYWVELIKVRSSGNISELEWEIPNYNPS
jgi:hypothetical protein